MRRGDPGDPRPLLDRALAAGTADTDDDTCPIAVEVLDTPGGPSGGEPDGSV